jgi:hypothetical protein
VWAAAKCWHDLQLQHAIAHLCLRARVLTAAVGAPQEPEDGGQGPPGGSQPKQPVEFDQAISYVNKIKVSSSTAGQQQHSWAAAQLCQVAGSAPPSCAGKVDPTLQHLHVTPTFMQQRLAGLLLGWCIAVSMRAVSTCSAVPASYNQALHLRPRCICP